MPASASSLRSTSEHLVHTVGMGDRFFRGLGFRVSDLSGRVPSRWGRVPSRGLRIKDMVSSQEAVSDLSSCAHSNLSILTLFFLQFMFMFL